MTTTYPTDRVQRRIRSLSIAVALVVAMMFCAAQAQAFCIYNKTNKTISVEQIKGGKKWKDFYAMIKSGDKACCNWKNKDCNKEGEKHSRLRFRVAYMDVEGNICKITVKAGGWAKIRGKHPDGRCATYY